MQEMQSDYARREFRALLDKVDRDGEHVTILRYQTPVAVIVPLRWYEDALMAIEDS